MCFLGFEKICLLGVLPGEKILLFLRSFAGVVIWEKECRWERQTAHLLRNNNISFSEKVCGGKSLEFEVANFFRVCFAHSFGKEKSYQITGGS